MKPTTMCLYPLAITLHNMSSISMTSTINRAAFVIVAFIISVRIAKALKTEAEAVSDKKHGPDKTRKKSSKRYDLLAASKGKKNQRSSHIAADRDTQEIMASAEVENLAEESRPQVVLVLDKTPEARFRWLSLSENEDVELCIYENDDYTRCVHKSYCYSCIH